MSEWHEEFNEEVTRFLAGATKRVAKLDTSFEEAQQKLAQLEWEQSIAQHKIDEARETVQDLCTHDEFEHGTCLECGILYQDVYDVEALQEDIQRGK